MRRFLPFVFFVAGAAIALAVVALWTNGSRRDPFTVDPSPGPNVAPVAADVGPDEIQRVRSNAIVRAVRRVSDAVVSIGVKKSQRLEDRSYPTVWDQFLSRALPRTHAPVWEVASGVLVDGRGLILTNEHVVRNAEDWWVVLSDGRFIAKENVRFVGADKYYDLAVLEVDVGAGAPVVAAPLGDSDQLMVGEWVIAIGNPFGFYLADPKPSVSVGVVSALGREILGEADGEGIYKNMIQTDAAINPGNSGGALVSAAGEVVGINTFILSTSGGSVGLGFALPINSARRVMDDILTHGRVRHPFVGLVQFEDVTSRVRHEFNVPSTFGVLIIGLSAGSPAAEAGVQPLDVIVRVNGRVVRNVEGVRREFFGMSIGDPVTLGIERNGRPMEFTFVMGERPPELRAGAEAPAP